MLRFIRSFLLLPGLIAMLVIIPAVAFANTLGAGLHSPVNQSNSTVPSPLPTPTPRPYPTVTPTRIYVAPTVEPTPTATPVSDGAVYLGSYRLKKVIGDRLSSTIYGYTTLGWLYRSLNDGVTWQFVTATPAVDDFVMNAQEPMTLYSGQRDCNPGSLATPMQKSIDGGLTWSALPASNNKLPLLAHQGDVNSLFAADCRNIYVTTDGGLTWVARPDSSADALWEQYIAVDMTSASLLGDPQPVAPNWEQLFVGGVSEDGSGVVAFTNDQGATWIRLTPNVFPAAWGMSSLTADLFTEGLVAFAEPAGVWSTENYGVNWKFSSKGLSQVVQQGQAAGRSGLNDLLYHPNGKLYLGTAAGLFSQEFGSNAWTKLSGNAYDNQTVSGLLYTETNLETLWLNTASGVYMLKLQ